MEKLEEMKPRARVHRGNRKLRRVTVVFCDPYHKLQLVEVHTQIKQRSVDTPYRVDRNEVEQLARIRLTEAGLETKSEAEHKLGIYHWDFVGVLVAHDDSLSKGRISWAEEVETSPAVTL